MRVRGFGELEAVIMDHLWEYDKICTVRDVHSAISTGRRIAYTTVMSTMDNLHRKGWLARERIGKAYQYWPTKSREAHTAALMRDAFDSGGDTDRVLTFFLEQMNDDESARLQAALRRLVDRNQT